MDVGTPAGNSPVDQPAPEEEEVNREKAKKNQSQEKAGLLVWKLYLPMIVIIPGEISAPEVAHGQQAEAVNAPDVGAKRMVCCLAEPPPKRPPEPNNPPPLFPLKKRDALEGF